MSDLIENLKQRIREIASCPHADYRTEFYKSLGRFVCENNHEILSALKDQKTVRGIEEITQGLWPVEIWPPCDDRTKWIVQGRLRYGEESTLSAAVEAARVKR